MKVMNYAPDFLKPGMITYEDIYNPLGAVILHRGTVLDDRHIDKIKLNGIEKVKIIIDNRDLNFGKEKEIKSAFNKEHVKEFRDKYIKRVDEITYVIKEIGKGAQVNIQDINQIGRHIVKDFETISDVINYLYFARPLDDYTYAHSLNVSLMSIILAKWIGLNEEEIDEIATAGLLHDIGKTKVPESLIMKPGRLTPEEFEEVKRHTIYGYEILENVKGATGNIKYSVLMHHEKIDGSGYPTGASEDAIPLFPKIIAIADIYDAMTSNRSYRSRMCPFEVIKSFEMQSFGKLDTKSLTIFMKNIANSYLGDFIELNTGEICEIVFINPVRVGQPIVRFGNEFIDLSRDNRKRYIKAII